MLSKRAKYAIKSLLFLQRNENLLPISAKKISEEEKIPYKFLENILRELKQNKILKSSRGSEGGYSFMKNPKEILVSDIIRIADGPIALIPCVSENFYEKCDECFDEEVCTIRKLFNNLRDQMLPVLEVSIDEMQRM